MISIKQSNYKIWWNNEGEDFPSLKILKEFNDSFIDSSYKLNYTGQFTAQIKTNSLDISNISAFKTESSEGFDNQIYIIKSIDRKTVGGMIILNLVIDLFSTYGYKLLELPNKFLTKRTHKFNNLSFQMEDTLLNSIPVYYDKNIVVEKRYPDSNGDFPLNNLTKINVISKGIGTYLTNFLSFNTNSNIYYVFGCGLNIKDTTKFTLIPYMGLTPPTLQLPSSSSATSILRNIFFYNSSKWESVISIIEEYKKEYANIVLEVIPQTIPDVDFINSQQTDNYNYANPNNNIITEAVQHAFQWDYRGFDTETNKFVGYASSINRIKIKYNGVWFNGFNIKLLYLEFDEDTPILPQELYAKNLTWVKPYDTQIKIIIKGQKKNIIQVSPNNYLEKIRNLINNTDLINKFQGIFFLPNLSNFTIKDPRDNLGVFKDFIGVEIGPEGINLPNFSICDQIRLNNFQEYNLKWNNDFITSILFLKYFDISYYSNSKNWNFYFDFDTSSINLSGKFTFNGVGSIVSNVGIDKTYNNIIEFPYQLPSALDQYKKYYSSIMDSTNTGMEVQKKNYEINKLQLGINTGLSAISTASSIAGNITSGNLSGGISDIINLGGNLGNTLFDNQKMDLNNSTYYKNLGARFSDVQRTQTANFSNSSLTDLSFLFSNTGKFNSEQIQMKVLTKDTIININNHIYLYGYQNIGWYDWNDLLPYDNFNYVELEHNELVRIIVNELDFKVRNIYEIVINFWDKGRRIWNSKPNKNDNILISGKFREK